MAAETVPIRSMSAAELRALAHLLRLQLLQPTGPVVVTPIYWNPAGHQMTDHYKGELSAYLHDVAVDSGSHTNVF